MVKKKKRTSRKKRTKGSRSLWITIGTVLVLLVAAVSILLYLEMHRERLSDWLRRGLWSGRAGVSVSEIRRINKRLDGYLNTLCKQSRIGKKDIQIHEREEKSERGTFVVKRIEIALPPTVRVQDFRRNLDHFAGKLPYTTVLTRREIAGRRARITLHLRVGSLVTRQIVLIPPARAVVVPMPGQPPAGPEVAIIVDDIGQSLRPVTELLSLDIPLTFSILPDRAETGKAAEMIVGQHRELMLHMPMQPIDYPKEQPGKDALLVRMSTTDIRRRVEQLLDKFPEVLGVNNHMGSRFTQDRERMSVVLQEVRKRNLFFVDSVTTNRSVAFEVARELGVRSARRDIFLDNVIRQDAIGKQIDKLMALAKRRGFAIAICHPHAQTIEALRDAISRFRKEGVEIVPVSELLDLS
jgi:polysaccharide deacetylase 2 family uncharacterized protein YibQ